MSFLKRKPAYVIVLAIISFIGVSFGERIFDENKDDVPAVGVGEEAPEIEMQDPEGEIRKLSDLKGKLVLIDFWAAWCRPCRAENPNVVRLYKKFKSEEFKYGDGFEVFSVSLDRNKTDWQRAIEQDGLIWDNHVSDLQGWQNAAAQRYGVRGIPATYLIDEDGVVLARNLRGKTLENALEKMRVE